MTSVQEENRLSVYINVNNKFNEMSNKYANALCLQRAVFKYKYTDVPVNSNNKFDKMRDAHMRCNIIPIEAKVTNSNTKQLF